MSAVNVTAPESGPNVTVMAAINSTCVQLSWSEPQVPNRLLGYRVGKESNIIVSQNLKKCLVAVFDSPGMYINAIFSCFYRFLVWS